jgi:transposase InsO family protein
VYNKSRNTVEVYYTTTWKYWTTRRLQIRRTLGSEQCKTRVCIRKPEKYVEREYADIYTRFVHISFGIHRALQALPPVVKRREHEGDQLSPVIA